MKGNIQEQTFFGQSAIHLQASHYEAYILPNIGANLVSFRHTERNLQFLREPQNEAEMGTLVENPTIWGIPVLFPPNRYEDGQFKWNGKQYNFPINEKDKNNHLHGFLHSVPWQVDSTSTADHECGVTLSLNIDQQHPMYKYFPHMFKIQLRYVLSAKGLFQHILIHNTGQDMLPCMLAFHTTLNAPFDPKSTASDYVFKANIGQRWEVNERMLPTGHVQPLNEDEQKIKTNGVNPFSEEMDNHYSANPVNGSNRMELIDQRTNIKLIYDAGTAYKHWMIWNNEATPGFFCPEPQTNRINAPNLQACDDEVGIIGVAPGEIWEETSRLYSIAP